MLLESQMPQSACREQTLQECTNKARLKPLYSQYWLEKCAKVIKLAQPVHEQRLLPTCLHHLEVRELKSGLCALIFLLRSPGYQALAGRWGRTTQASK